MIPRKNFAQPAIFCPAGRPDRVFQKVHLLGTSRTKDQNGKISKIRPTARASPAPIESHTARHLARLPGSEKGTFPRNVSDKSPKNHFRRLYGCGSGGAKWPRARRKFFGRPGSSRKVHSLGMSRTKVQNVARNGVPFVREGLGLGKIPKKFPRVRLSALSSACVIRASARPSPRPSARPSKKVHSLGMSRTKVQNRFSKSTALRLRVWRRQVA